MTLLLYGALFRYQNRRVFRPLGLVTRRDRRGLLIFLVLYQALMSAMSVIRYGQQVFRMRRSWK